MVRAAARPASLSGARSSLASPGTAMARGQGARPPPVGPGAAVARGRGCGHPRRPLGGAQQPPAHPAQGHGRGQGRDMCGSFFLRRKKRLDTHKWPYLKGKLGNSNQIVLACI